MRVHRPRRARTVVARSVPLLLLLLLFLLGAAPAAQAAEVRVSGLDIQLWQNAYGPYYATNRYGWRYNVTAGCSKAYPEHHPYGYWRLYKPLPNGRWQPIDPSTGRPGAEWETHIPLPSDW